MYRNLLKYVCGEYTHPRLIDKMLETETHSILLILKVFVIQFMYVLYVLT